MLELFRKTGLSWDKGKLLGSQRGKPSPACKRPEFYRGVAADISLVLYRTEPAVRLDGVDQRRFLMDKRGLIYDHIDDRFVHSNPFIRVSLCTAWRFFEDAEVPQKKEPPAVVIVVIGGRFLATAWGQTPISVVISVVIQSSSVVIISVAVGSQCNKVGTDDN